MLDDFMVRALLAGIGLAVVSAPLGCFVVWRRMAYFGEATAHAAMLGVALSLAVQTDIFFGALIFAIIMAWITTQLSGRNYAMDTLLGVFSHSFLAVGLVVVSFLTGVRIDLMAYLFGDILAVSKSDLSIIWVGALFVLGLIIWRWKPLFLSTFNEELSYASGFNPKREQLFLTIGLGVTVAVSIKVVGVLLITAMLIIPAAAARNLARDPEMMVFAAGLVSCFSVIAGLRASYIFDTPPGPSIVCVTLFVFIVLNLVNSVRRLKL
jgi:zinc transport system permease protein|tara:strand:+ start:70 stop:867 length:798 start_codon:yes stop_codon:yes gene_type:complete